MIKINIATLNLCQGLQLKKNLVKELIIRDQIDVLCMQETQINLNIDHNLLSFPGYTIETETNTSTSRTAIYIRNNIQYLRRRELEGQDSHLVIIDLLGSHVSRIINLYRSFTPQHDVTQRDKFGYQLELIKNASTTNTILLGDFNLDWSKYHSDDYSHKNYFSDMDQKLGASNLIQLVDFITWTRTVNGQVKQSVLDHIYAADPLLVTNLKSSWPVFTDHALVLFTISSSKSEPEIELKRDWRHYTKEKLNHALAQHEWSFESDSVQAYWDQLENQLVAIVDELIPLVQ